jgi:small subunit ribosomal protein S4
MARYTGPACKLCRREGEKLFLKGERCLTPKCAIERRNYAPGMHGPQAQYRRKESDYALQLREKQKAKRIYGVVERQFRRYFRVALRRKGMTGVNLLILLERRLDNVVYRLGWATSRTQARQLVQHGHFDVNGRKTNIPSYLVKTGDVIAVRQSSKDTAYFKSLVKELGHSRPPDWLSSDIENLVGQVLNLPTREHIDLTIREQLVVEYYSR